MRQLFFVFFTQSCFGLNLHAQEMEQHFHLANSWYPGEKSALQSSIEKMEKQAIELYGAILKKSDIKAIIVPHAGYDYSGVVATGVYRLCDKNIVKKVIILAPDHSVSYDGVALPNFSSYQTPLGSIGVDKFAIDKLTSQKLFEKKDAVFNGEHSLEVQLPFIKSYFPNAVIVPLIVGRVSCQQSASIAKILKSVIDKNTLVVVTSDFIHYGKRFGFVPFTDNIALNIRQLDSRVVSLIEAGRCAPFGEFVQKTGATICGLYPLSILLSLLEIDAFGKVEPRLVAYDTSGSQQKNFNESVSYIGMLFTSQKLSSVPFEDQLTQQEKRGLLQEGYDVLNNLFKDKNRVDNNLLYPITSLGVRQSRGAFVTLEKMVKSGKELRGCIGRISSYEPLYKTVADVTVDTAFHDSRFSPVEKKELPTLSLKISVLSPSNSIATYKDIVLGKHGVILDFNGRSALFLPEVPIEFGWGLETMLGHLSVKAGLDIDAWRSKDAKFKVFTTVSIE